MDALKALQQVDFNWTMQLESVWHPLAYHTETLHQEVRQAILDQFARITANKGPNPFGQIIIGRAGAGKTHLLNSLCQTVMAQQHFFVLVDMTDVNHFTQTLLSGFLNSLEQCTADGLTQYQRLIDGLFTQEMRVKDVDANPSLLFRQLQPEQLLARINQKAIPFLTKRYRQQMHRHQDVLRALLLLNSDQASDIGYSWLQGLALDPETQASYGLRSAAGEPMAVIEGLSWLLSLVGATLLAFDQLDSIVSNHHLTSGTGDPDQWNDTQRASLAVIQNIASGLMALRDKTYRTLPVIACLEPTWHILEQRALRSVMGRFDSPIALARLGQSAIAQEMISKRLQLAYQSVGFVPPYPTYPFKPEAFAQAGEYSPRELLRICYEHCQSCVRVGQISELATFHQSQESIPAPADNSSDAIEQRFQQLQAQANLDLIEQDDQGEEALAQLLQTACRCRFLEQKQEQMTVETDFAGKGYRPLHVRISRFDQGQEHHFAFRALQHQQPLAFQNRLHSAMMTAGIDQAFPFRHLIIVRTRPIPSGPKTQALFAQFQQAGGILHHPTEDELRILFALQQLLTEQPLGLDAWLQTRQLLCQLPLMQAARLCHHTQSPTANSNQQQTDQDKPPQHNTPLLLGHRLSGKQRTDPVTIPLTDLTRHSVILAGAGSGKTVLVRRLIEEAALIGIPTLVVDGANDLSRLGSAWPEPPANWLPEDKDKAAQFFATTEVCVWTPGREKGNPLGLAPLPDLAALANDKDELEQAINMVRANLAEIIAPGKSAKSQKKHGIFNNALRAFARQDQQGFTQLIDHLAELPADASGDISNAATLAREMADALRSEMATNPLLHQQGTQLDPNVLLQSKTGQPRISIINLIGLPALASQQFFVAQLAMTLFSWIKRYPATATHPLQGLLVIDEAKDFVPSNKSVPSKEPLIRLTAQARKYGLGIIFASQAPKSIDHQVITNCTTQFYGKANSPAAIEVVQSQLRQRGGHGADIPNLNSGHFYVCSETLNHPQKIVVPMCLSHHPATPPDEESILSLAAQSRLQCGQMP